MASLLSGAWGSFQRPLASHLLNSVANFSKYISKARAKRQPLTTKRAGKGYYKGNGCRKEGSLNSKGMITEMSYNNATKQTEAKHLLRPKCLTHRTFHSKVYQGYVDVHGTHDA